MMLFNAVEESISFSEDNNGYGLTTLHSLHLDRSMVVFFFVEIGQLLLSDEDRCGSLYIERNFDMER